MGLGLGVGGVCVAPPPASASHKQGVTRMVGVGHYPRAAPYFILPLINIILSPSSSGIISLLPPVAVGVSGVGEEVKKEKEKEEEEEVCGRS